MVLETMGYVVTDLSIGEGTVLHELGTDTMKGYKWIQLDRLTKRFGVRLIDFNAGPYRNITSGDVPTVFRQLLLIRTLT